MGRLTFAAVSLLFFFSQASAATSSSSPQAYSVPASQYWDGDDGQWSTFSFQVGTPFQQVRLLPSTSGSAFAPILSIGCTSQDASTCPSSRGGLFNTQASTSWSKVGTYQYTAPYSQNGLLGNSANASYGTDNMTLAWPGSPAPTVPNQIVTGLVSDTSNWYYLGQFGLSPRPVNISTLNDNRISTLSYLKNNSIIPSTSWGYTAGFYNQDPPAFGSLTLGGYDSSRFRPNSVSFPFGIDISRDLLVGVQRITSDKTGSTPLLPNPVYAFIDSELPSIVLPQESCTAFERAFNLTYYQQNGAGYYLLTNDQHQSLLSKNPTITFTLGPSLAGGSTVDISLPYAAFDLQLTPPLGRNGTRYFPLQRGANSSQYVLGRTFLQHAYVIADYDRSNFSVSQALFPQNTPAQVKSIYAPGYSGDGSNTSTISGGAIAGIVIGVIVVLAIVGALLWFFVFRKRRALKKKNARIELDNTQPDRLGGAGAAPAYDSIYAKSGYNELGADEHTRRHEAEALEMQRAEMGGSKRDSRQEMDGGEWTKGTARGAHRTELDAGQTVAEMEGHYGPDGKKELPQRNVFELA